jgi:(1->4)-alpha-D-glucan 1-alpha-D-glucosylmutase
LQETIAGFRVYRTYISDGHLLERDRHYVETAVAHAKRRNPAMNPSIFDFVRDLLLLRYRENADESEREAQRRFVGKFQQLTGPIMAKAIEDTAFYRYNRLVSLNEVGGEPKRFGASVAEFHQHNQQQRARSSRSLLATSTHDTRARIHVLSEVPGQWRSSIFRWRRWNRRLKTDVEGEASPSRNDEYLLYQTLLGVWPGLPWQGDAPRRLARPS